MGLLAEIQNDALSDTIPVATLLRKVLVLASNLDSGLLEDWVRHELNGYPPNSEVPEYRTMGINFKANAASVAWKYNGMPIAPMIVEDLLKDDTASLFKCRQAIGTINPDEINKSSGTLRLNFDNLAPLIQTKLEPGVGLMSFWGEVPSSQVLGIIDAVRSRVLDFVLALKKMYPSAGEIDGLTTKMPEVERTVTTIYNNTIHGNVGVAGNAQGNTINITVNHGNMQELHRELTRHGVEEADLIELKAALTEEPDIGADRKFGPKVAAWMGKMAGKAASGAWGVGLNVGAAVLQAALLGYYGLSG